MGSVDVVDSDEHTSLLLSSINYIVKIFIVHGPLRWFRLILRLKIFDDYFVLKNKCSGVSYLILAEKTSTRIIY
jgi:hypothetical protein